MTKFRYTKRLSLKLVILSLFMTLPLLTTAQSVRAHEGEGINPHAGSNNYLLLEGQTVSTEITLSTSSNFHSVGIASIGNNQLTASLSISGEGVTGFWWLTIIGTGGKYWFDFKCGIIPVTGPTAEIDISSLFSVGLITGGVILTSPLPAEDEDPVTYTISATGSYTEG